MNWPWSKKQIGIMEPDTRTDEEYIRDSYPLAQWDCTYISYKYPPAGCQLDRNNRECTGKCSRFEAEGDKSPLPEPPPIRYVKENGKVVNQATHGIRTSK